MTDTPESPKHEWTDADIAAALSRSGYALEQRVERLLVERGYEVHASRRVPDPETGKGREMDLLAELREARTAEQAQVRPAVVTSLLIECINNRMPLVFFEKPVTWAESISVPTLLGVPLHVPEKPGSTGFYLLEDEASVSWRNTLTRWATQFCSFEEKSGRSPRLNAIQLPDHHGTFEKLIAESERLADRVMNREMIEAGWMGGWLTLIRPVVVLQGRLMAAAEGGGDLSTQEREHMHYLRRGVVEGRRVAWVVDIVTEAGLPRYLKGVSETLDRVRSYCIDQRDRVQEAFTSESTRRMALLERSAAR